ncbi:phospholipase D family protein [Thermodesulfobacteriota bacterium]
MDRNLLLEALRPPDGYQLDHALGTTFTLDLYALLTAPLAFTLFEGEHEHDHNQADPLTLLESLRRHAANISLFCQAGYISVPKKQERLFAYLEKSVHEVTAPSQKGIFHPKIWLIRYKSENAPIIYRFICLSRNLTFDRSWDRILVLNGQLTDRNYGYSRNNPIGDFVQQLGYLCIQPLGSSLLQKIDEMQHEVRRVNFSLPEGIEDLSFHPLGIKGYRNFRFNTPRRRMLVMSPFLTDGFLNDAVARRNGCVLISRLESLEKVSKVVLDQFEQVYFLSPEAEIEESSDEDDQDQETSNVLSGLHAKMFVVDDGWYASIWTGSANATTAAFKENVEMLVHLRAKRSRFGIDKILDPEDAKISFRDMLHEYQVTDDSAEADVLREALEETLTEVRKTIASRIFTATISTAERDSTYDMRISHSGSKELVIPTSISVHCWPVSLRDSMALEFPFETPEKSIFRNLSIDAISAFLAFEVTCTQDSESLSQRFICKCSLENGPTDRLILLLRSLLENKQNVLRFILLLLADNSMPVSELLDLHKRLARGGSESVQTAVELPVLETMLRTLARDPSRLDQVNGLIEELQSMTETENLLPDGFMSIWEPIWQARKEMAS